MSSLTLARLVPIAALLLVSCKGQQTEQDADPIVFAPKSFHDGERTGPTHGLVYVAGTLTGPDIGYENNSTAITCYKDRMECLVYQVRQIGKNQIGRLDWPNSYPITKWAPEEVVASSGTDDAVNCNRTTISILRSTETALWVIEPINQSQAQCKDSNTKVIKWTIEDPPWWKASKKN